MFHRQTEPHMPDTKLRKKNPALGRTQIHALNHEACTLPLCCHVHFISSYLMDHSLLGLAGILKGDLTDSDPNKSWTDH